MRKNKEIIMNELLCNFVFDENNKEFLNALQLVLKMTVHAGSNKELCGKASKLLDALTGGCFIKNDKEVPIRYLTAVAEGDYCWETDQRLAFPFISMEEAQEVFNRLELSKDSYITVSLED